mgnify:CR=1 FL=1
MRIISVANKKGSVLAFSLIIMSMILVSGVAILGASVAMERASLAGSKSPQAYLKAESYAELALQEFRLGDTAHTTPTFDNVLSSNFSCPTGGNSWSADSENVTLTVSKLDGSGNKVGQACNDPIPNTTGTSIYIKVLAKNQGVQRAVEVKYTF